MRSRKGSCGRRRREERARGNSRTGEPEKLITETQESGIPVRFLRRGELRWKVRVPPAIGPSAPKPARRGAGSFSHDRNQGIPEFQFFSFAGSFHGWVYTHRPKAAPCGTAGARGILTK